MPNGSNKTKSRRRLKKAEISRISLVPRGANQMPVFYKSEDDGNSFDFQTLLKLDKMEESGELLSIVYAPEIRDSHGDIASADVIKDMAYRFAQNGLGEIDLRHDGKELSKEQAWVAESFLVQKDDARFGGMKDYSGNEIPSLEGAWATLIKIEDPQIRKLFTEGKWNGVSMHGGGIFQEDDTIDKADRNRLQDLIDKLASHLGLSKGHASHNLSISGDIEMDKSELIALLKENNEGLVAGISKAFADAIKPVEKAAAPIEKTEEKPAAKAAPVFKGDISKQEDIRLFSYQKQRYEIEKSMDATDPESVLQASEQLADLDKDFEDIAELRKSTPPARRRAAPSNAGERDNHFSGIDKEEASCIEAGKKMAAAVNKSRGLN